MGSLVWNESDQAEGRAAVRCSGQRVSRTQGGGRHGASGSTRPSPLFCSAVSTAADVQSTEERTPFCLLTLKLQPRRGLPFPGPVDDGG